MQRLIIVVLFSALAVGIISAVVVMSKGSSAASKPPIIDEATVTSSQNSPGTINGLSNPELIPNRAAYLILFRLIANRRTPEERNRIESYIRGMLNIRCRSCGALNERVNIENTGRTPEQERADIDAVFATVEEFNQQVELLDNQARVARERRRSDPQARQQLIALQAQKNALVESKIATLINSRTFA